MKNIILQHWSGEMNELGELSSANISKYAEKIGVEYKLIRGDKFRSNLKVKHPPIQKLHMLSRAFDEYDMTVMLDMDMFTRKGMEENVFTDVEGVGVHAQVQKRLVKHLQQRIPELTDPEYCYWGGSIYRLTREQRQKLRAGIRENEIPVFCNRRNHGDEGLMHVLAVRAQIKDDYLPDRNWNYPSFETDIENASIIHVRTKIAPRGPKRTKMENYKDLVSRGLIEE